jgi:predicted transcriptional regulator
MVDIRKVWPDVTDDTIEVFPRLTQREWFILSRIWSQKRFVNAEISEDDLLQGVKTSEKGNFRGPLEMLVKRGILSCESKHTVFVYKGNIHHEIFKQPGTTKILEEARSNPMKDALKYSRIEIKTIPEDQLRTMVKILETSKGKREKSHLISYEILGPTDEVSAFSEGEHGARIRYTFECPQKKKHFDVAAEVESATLMFHDGKDVPCPWCGGTHHIKLAGRLDF